MAAIRNGLTLICMLVLSACIVPVPRQGQPLNIHFMSPQQLRDYSEQVFRQHNQVMTRLMTMELEFGKIDPQTEEQLEQAEAQMSQACASLNEAASLRASGSQPSRKLGNEVRRSIRDCKAETARMADLLDRISTEQENQKTG
ncbi:MAG: hypothetical protein RQ741_10120 [Wenzhouxiangellaceae bacterium]|nr:hypothetical protein [Wenzhouxiangellaceae bacterium]